MEFEVLNHILTGTVAQLFTGPQSKQSAPNYKTSSQMGQDKSDIPRRSNPLDSMSARKEDLEAAGVGEDTPMGQWLLKEAK